MDNGCQDLTSLLNLPNIRPKQTSLHRMVALVPRDLARSNRVWQGKIPIASFSRLHEVLGKRDGHVRVQLDFSYDENGRVRVVGQAVAPAELMCYTCMQSQKRDVTAEIDVCIVSSEREAKEIFADFDAVVLHDGPTTIEELVEDDILLSVPSQVCAEGESCANRPRSFENKPADRYRPFQKIGQVVKTVEKS